MYSEEFERESERKQYAKNVANAISNAWNDFKQELPAGIDEKGPYPRYNEENNHVVCQFKLKEDHLIDLFTGPWKDFDWRIRQVDAFDMDNNIVLYLNLKDIQYDDIHKMIVGMLRRFRKIIQYINQIEPAKIYNFLRGYSDCRFDAPPNVEIKVIEAKVPEIKAFEVHQDEVEGLVVNAVHVAGNADAADAVNIGNVAESHEMSIEEFHAEIEEFQVQRNRRQARANRQKQRQQRNQNKK